MYPKIPKSHDVTNNRKEKGSEAAGGDAAVKYESKIRRKIGETKGRPSVRTVSPLSRANAEPIAVPPPYWIQLQTTNNQHFCCTISLLTADSVNCRNGFLSVQQSPAALRRVLREPSIHQHSKRVYRARAVIRCRPPLEPISFGGAHVELIGARAPELGRL